MKRIATTILLVGFAVTPLACIRHNANPAATQPVTNIEPDQALVSYWVRRPASAQVNEKDFTTLWEACEQLAHDYFFLIDRRDYRAGILSTQPLIGRQWFEPWRKDTATSFDTKQASLSAMRRTIFFQFTQNLDGGYTVAPKVVVEREAKVEQKYRTPDSDVPVTYWYAVRRDGALEAKIVESLTKRLHRESAVSQ